MRVLISGLTAAGKTTHSKLLAQELGYEWLGATEALLELAGVDSARFAGRSVWGTDAGRLIEDARGGDSLDRRLDDYLLAAVRSRPNVVVDAWAMPWLWEGPAIRVWLESTLESRVAKCIVSDDLDPSSDRDRAERLLHEKDGSTRARFLRMYGFDMFEDREPFDVMLDNSDLIAEPTRAAADIGIAAFRPVLRSAVDAALNSGGPDGPELGSGRSDGDGTTP